MSEATPLPQDWELYARIRSLIQEHQHGQARAKAGAELVMAHRLDGPSARDHLFEEMREALKEVDRLCVAETDGLTGGTVIYVRDCSIPFTVVQQIHSVLHRVDAARAESKEDAR